MDHWAGTPGGMEAYELGQRRLGEAPGILDNRMDSPGMLAHTDTEIEIDLGHFRAQFKP